MSPPPSLAGRQTSPGGEPTPSQGLSLVLAVFGLLCTAGVGAQYLAIYPGLLFTEFGLLLLPALALCRRRGWSPWQVLMLGAGRSGSPVAAAGVGLLAFAMALALTLPVLMLVLLAGGTYPGVALPLETSGQFALALLAGALAAPLCEEILFRGLLLRSLADHGPHAAVWISAVAFGIFHMDPVRFVPTLALGVVYGYLAAGTGSVRAPIIAHAVNNGLALTLAFLGGGAGRPEGLHLSGLREEVERSLATQAPGLPAALSPDQLLVGAAGVMFLVGLMLAALVHLALCGLAAPEPVRFTAFVPAGRPRRRLRGLLKLPALWGIGGLGLVIWALALWGIFAGEPQNSGAKKMPEPKPSDIPGGEVTELWSVPQASIPAVRSVSLSPSYTERGGKPFM